MLSRPVFVFLYALLCLGMLARPASSNAAERLPDPMTPPANGPKRAEPSRHAIVGATVHVSPGRVIESGTVLVRDGRIERVADGRMQLPEGYRVWEGDGLHVHAGFLEPYLEIEAPTPDPSEPGAHWNSLVTPQRSALDGPWVPKDHRSSLRGLGFVAAAIAPEGGIFRGTSAAVSLAEPGTRVGDTQPPIYRERVFHSVSFETAGGGPGPDGLGRYPNSQMGAIAVLRQGLLDADYERDRDHADPDAVVAPVYDALNRRDLPMVFDCTDERRALWTFPIAEEFGRPTMVLGSGFEFKRLRAIADAGLPVLCPLRFPKTPDVSTFGKAESIDLERLMAWEQAPTNARRLIGEGLDVALTTHRLKDKSAFRANLRRAIAHGLSQEQALAALTTTPARLLGLEDRLGTIEPGMIASFVVADGPVFHEDTVIRDVWIDGLRHEINPAPDADPSGEWSLTLPGGDELALTVTGKGKKVRGQGAGFDADAHAVKYEGGTLTFALRKGEGDAARHWLFTGLVSDRTISGQGVRPMGEGRFEWAASRTAPVQVDEDEANGEDQAPSQDERDAEDVPEHLGTPFGAYGRAGLPDAISELRLENATVWTSAQAGVIEDATVVVRNGQIAYVGPADRAPAAARDATVVDAQGMHVTPGFVDAHSHTGTYAAGIAVNESAQAVTAEVRIGDVFDPGHINWYRQLAGGTTTAMLLHGSANPIGGQSHTVKVRWGSHDRDTWQFKDAPAGIKFALGENVKQSNWGDRSTTRYPQTRMGVESIIRDRFVAAGEYAASRERARREGMPFRTDLELEAIAEILAGTRRIHCHSYRQDEILMLCRLAGEFGVTIGTFQHVLEGYKIAEAIREHAIGGSAFADWWAFKVEVQDAIAAGGAIMHEQGVVVSYNSDSDELARHLNDEAAKAVKYGGVSPETALAFVTINPAIQLGINAQVGSIEEGKHADLVLWSGPPLSTMSRCLATYIDGRPYFTEADDRRDRARIHAERHRLIQKVLARTASEASDTQQDDAEDSADDTTPRRGRLALRLMHQRIRDAHELLNRGLDPTIPTCGDCGMPRAIAHH